MAKPKIPLGDMLSAIDRNDFDFYSQLDSELKKEFSPWMAMRYASSARGAAVHHYLLMVNDIVNVDFSLLKDHPDLQWKLLAVCGMGSNKYHEFIHPGKKQKKNKLETLLMERYPTLNKDERKLLTEINSTDELKELARDTGMNDKEIKELFK